MASAGYSAPTALMVDQFERMANEKVRELKLHYRQIQHYEQTLDIENLIHEKASVQRMISSMIEGFKQVLSKRQNLPAEERDAFDARVDPIQRQTHAIVNAIMALIEKPLPVVPKEDAPKKESQNIFDDCFAPEDHDTYGGIKSSTTTSTSAYEEQLMAQTQTDAQARAEEARLRVLRAKEDSEAIKQVARDIEDLNQVMEDLATLVHCQHDMVDSIEDHVEKATYQVHSGNQQLKKALANKNAQVPIVAAGVGAAAAGGPVGIVAGSAVLGVVAGIGGAVAGLFGGRFIKNQVKKSTEVPSNDEPSNE
uniref:t-SNARE coiled-coil homology domain-containing protein n=1 Tax=Panagrellus redivivus TaxID=6233 RepID=A0A7E4VQE7_PANRE